MKLIKVSNVKQFMNKLLIETAFDSFLISEATIKTGNSFVIDGHINADFYSSDELDALREEAKSNGRIFSEKMSRFESVKPVILSLIKGKKTPIYFKLSFYLADENINKFISSSDTLVTANDIDHLSLIIKFSNDELTLTTSAGLKIFSLDKSIEKHWDEMIIKFLNAHSIEFDLI